MDAFTVGVIDNLANTIYYTNYDIPEVLDQFGFERDNFNIPELTQALKIYHDLIQCDDCGEWKFRRELAKHNDGIILFLCKRCEHG